MVFQGQSVSFSCLFVPSLATDYELHEALRRIGANEVLSERTSRLCAAMLRIGASLELDVILREIVENACELADARYGIITTTDATGKAEDVVMSGFTAEERQQILDWPDGLRLFEHFRGLPGVLRLTNLSSVTQSRRADRTIHLTATEYRLLRALSLRAGKVVNDELIRLGWSGCANATTGDVRTFVKKLRDKLGDNPAERKYILNVRGAGYTMHLPDDRYR